MLKEKLDRERELEIKEAEIAAVQRQEVEPSSLEKKSKRTSRKG